MIRVRVAAAVGLLVVASACSDGATSSSPSASSTGPLSGRLTVQAAGGEGEIKALEEMVTAFEAANRDVDVALVPVAAQSEHISKLGTAFAGGNPPDVFLLNYRRFGRFAASGVISPAQDHLGGFDLKELYDKPVEAFTFDGKVLCLPSNNSSSVVYFNPALLARASVAAPKAGWTWDDLRAAATKLGAANVKSFGAETGIRTVAPFVWQAGGDVVDDLAKPTRITLGTPPARAALQLLLDLQQTGLTATDRAAEEPADTFARGELALFVDSRRAVPSLRKAGVDFDVAPLPRGADGEATLLASDGYCVAAASKNRAAAHAFARFAVAGEGAKVLARTGRTVPAMKSIANTADYLAPGQKPSSARVWLDVADSARRLPNVAEWNEAEEVASEILDQLFAGRITLDAAIARIDRDTHRILTRDG